MLDFLACVLYVDVGSLQIGRPQVWGHIWQLLGEDLIVLSLADSNIEPVSSNSLLLILIPKCLRPFLVVQFCNWIRFLVDQKVIEIFFLDTFLLAHVDAFWAPLLAITAVAYPLAVWLAFLVVTQFCLTIACIHYATVTVRPALADLALCHAQDPIILVLVAVGRVSLSIMRFVKASELYYASISCETRSYVIVKKELALVRIEHLLIPVSQLHVR